MLERTTVKDILALRPIPPPEPVSERTQLPVVIERFTASGQTCLPVVDGNDSLVGVISFQAVQQALGSRGALANLVVARELAMPAVTVTSDQSLYSALAKMSEFDSKELIVVEPSDGKSKVVAILTSGDINAIYDEQILNPPQQEPTTGVALGQAFKRWLPKGWLPKKEV